MVVTTRVVGHEFFAAALAIEMENVFGNNIEMLKRYSGNQLEGRRGDGVGESLKVFQRSDLSVLDARSTVNYGYITHTAPTVVGLQKMRHDIGQQAEGVAPNFPPFSIQF
ncbi:hypothetical protein BGLA2_420124 [Burkholderia gladioli]|nr:hypothetical protein BGLA2_420124 [Burkholderia gladioli]